MLRKIFIVILLSAFGIGLATESEQPVREKALFNCRLKNGDSMPLKDVVSGWLKIKDILKDEKACKYYAIRAILGGHFYGFCLRYDKLTWDTVDKLDFLKSNRFVFEWDVRQESQQRILMELKEDGLVDGSGCVDPNIKSLAESSLGSYSYRPASPGCIPSFWFGSPIDFKRTIIKDFWGL